MAMTWFREMQYVDVCWSHEMFGFRSIVKVVMTAMTATTVSFFIFGCLQSVRLRPFVLMSG